MQAAAIMPRGAETLRHRLWGESDSGLSRRARGLGWFSLALGAAELFAPRAVARLLGARNDGRTKTTLQLAGLREIASGIGIFSQPRPAGWLWARVVGDVIDLGLLGTTLAGRKPERHKTNLATAALLGVTVLDAVTAGELWRLRARSERGIYLNKTITVNRQPAEVYGFWRHLQNLPRFMSHLESVEVDGGRSHWRARLPGGFTLEWDAEIIEDRPNQYLAWRSLPGARVPNEGVVRFDPAPGGRGTELRVELHYDPPGAHFGGALAEVLRGLNAQQIENDLRRLKQVLETGEVVQSDASIHRGPHPARPSRQNGGRRGVS